MIILPEEQRDYLAVHMVNTSAFKTVAEANLVEVLRREAHPYISLVAEGDGEIVGHIFFTPVVLSGCMELKGSSATIMCSMKCKKTIICVVLSPGENGSTT